MKKVISYTSDEHARFKKIYEFLDYITAELDDQHELTSEREEIIDYAQNAIEQIENFFDN